MAPETWTTHAVELPHPQAVLDAIDAWLATAIVNEAYRTPLDLAATRTDAAKELKRRRVAASPQEAIQRASLHPDIEGVTAPKQTVCLAGLLADYAYADRRLADEIRTGFPSSAGSNPVGSGPPTSSPRS